MYLPKLQINGVEVDRPNSENEFGLQPYNQQMVNDIFSKQENIITTHSKTIDPSIDWDKYKKYGVVPNPISTEEDIKRQAAEYQSNWSKLSNAVVQGLYNEAVIGTFKAFGDLYDLSVAAIKKDEGVGNYTSGYTKFLEDYQEQIRNQFEVYKKNPGKTFDMSDFGWWAEGFVNVATTLSLLIPSRLISKSLSYIPKGIVKGMSTAGKMNKSYSLMGNTLMKINKSKVGKVFKNTDINNVIAKTDAFNDIAATAFMSRTLENRQEAREVYKNNYNSYLDQLNKMTPAEKAEFLARNEGYGFTKDTSNEDIAKTIANIAAKETFVNDYWMLLMDVAQYAGINKLFTKNMFGKIAGKDIAYENQQLIKSLGKTSREYADNITARSATKSVPKGLKDKLKDIKQNGIDKITLGNTILFGVESAGEGFEELFQGIQSARGANIGEMMLNPEVTERTLNSYLSDPTIWEQAFWGAIGGAVFQGAGSLMNKASRELYIKKNKDKLSDEQIDNLRNSVHQHQLLDITRRREATEKLYANLSDIENGKNPFRFKHNLDGTIYRDENGNVEKEDIEESQAELLKNKVLDNYLLDMYFSAYKAGTTELLREFINSKELARSMFENTTNMGNNAQEFNRKLNERFNQIANTFNNTLYSIGMMDFDYNPDAVEIYTKQIVNDIIRGQQDETLSKYLDKLIIEYSNGENFEEYSEQDLIKQVTRKLNELNIKEEEIKRLYHANEISYDAIKIKLNEIDRIKDSLAELIQTNTISEVLKNTIWDVRLGNNNRTIKELEQVLNQYIYDNYDIEIPSNRQLSNTINLKNQAIIDKTYTEAQIPNLNNKNEIKQGYDEFAYMLDKYIITKEEKALEKLINYIKNNNNPELAYLYIITPVIEPNSLPEDIKEAAKIINPGKRTKINDDGNIQEDINISLLKRAVQERLNDIAKNNRNQNEGTVLTEEQQDENIVEEIEEEIINIDEEKTNDDETPISTGEKTRTEQDILESAEQLEIEERIDYILTEPEQEVEPEDDSVLAPSADEIYKIHQQNDISKEIKKLVLEEIKNNPQIFEDIINNGYTKSKSFKTFYEDILAKLKDFVFVNGYTFDNSFIQKEIALQINFLSTLVKYAEKQNIKNLEKGLKELYNQMTRDDVINVIDKMFDSFSTIAGIDSTTTMDEIFNKFLERYIEERGIIVRKNNNNETFIDVENFLNEIILNDKLTEQDKILLISNFVQFSSEDNYYLLNRSLYDKHKGNVNNLINAIVQKRKENDDKLIADTHVIRIGGYEQDIDIVLTNTEKAYTLSKDKPSNIQNAIYILRNRNNHNRRDINNAKQTLNEFVKDFIIKNINNPKYKIDISVGEHITLNLINTSNNQIVISNIGFLSDIERNPNNTYFGTKLLIYRKFGLINNNGFVWGISEVLNSNNAISYVPKSIIDNYFTQLIEAANNQELAANNTDRAKLLNILLSRNNGENTKNIPFDSNNQNDVNQSIELLNNPLVQNLGIGDAVTGVFGARIEIGGSKKNVLVRNNNGNITIVYYDINGNQQTSTLNDDIVKVANVVLTQTNGILLHDFRNAKKSGNISKTILLESYNHFKEIAYNNYKKQAEIIDAIKSGKSVNANFVRFNRESINVDTTGNTKTRPSELTEHINSVDNPIVISEDIFAIKVEGIDTPIQLYDFNRSSSDMGIMMNNPKKEKPVIVWLHNDYMESLDSTGQETHPYEKNKQELADAVKQEIRKVLETFESSDKNEEDFKEVYNKLSQLLGGANSNRGNLFSGVDLFYSHTDKGSAISIILDNKKLGNNKIKDVVDIVILSGGDKFKNTYVYYKNETQKDKKGDYLNKTLDKLVDTMFKSVKFNKSFYMFKTKSVSNDNNKHNPYFRKKDGKLNITIDGYNKSFDTFGQFLYTHNGFTLPLSITSNGTIKEIGSSGNMTPEFTIQYDFVDTSQSPVEKEKLIYNQHELLKTIENRDKDNRIDTIKLLQCTNIDSRYLEMLFGKNAENINLLDTSIYYEETPPVNAKGVVKIKGNYYGRFDKSTGRIYLSKYAIDTITNIGNNGEYDMYSENIRDNMINGKKSREFLRVILHENIHKRIKENGGIKEQETVDGLLNTLIAAVESLSNTDNPNKENIKTWFDKQLGVKYDSQGKVDIDATIKAYSSKNGITSNREHFAEEWLTEVLTNQALIEYLSNTKYVLNGKEIEVNQTSEKSIFQKIIDILLKIFNINLENREKNSIFAEQYRLLNAINGRKQNTTKKSKTGEKTTKKSTKKESTKQTKKAKKDIIDLQTEITFEEESTNKQEVKLPEVKELTDEEIIQQRLLESEEEYSEDEDVPQTFNTDDIFSTIEGFYTEEEIVLSDYKLNGVTNIHNVISAPDVNTFLEMFPNSEKLLIAENIKNGGVVHIC